MSYIENISKPIRVDMKALPSTSSPFLDRDVLLGLLEHQGSYVALQATRLEPHDLAAEETVYQTIRDAHPRENRLTLLKRWRCFLGRKTRHFFAIWGQRATLFRRRGIRICCSTRNSRRVERHVHHYHQRNRSNWRSTDYTKAAATFRSQDG